MQEIKEKLITVIVPVYNVESYLNHCMETIINQTYKNLEIILIDDGSTDLSGSICDTIASLDERIVVLHKKNGGLSDARNVALDLAKGEYITFVDSDDYLPLDSIEYLYNLIKKYNADISVGSMFLTPELNLNITIEETKVNQFDHKSSVREMLYGSLYTASASGKLYNASLFEGIRYPVGKVNEDLFTTYRLLDRAKLTVSSDKLVYYYYHRPGSIMNSVFSERRLDVLLALDQIESDINLDEYQARNAFSGLVLSTSTTLLALKPEDYLIKKYKIWDRIKYNRFAVLREPRCNKTIKAYAILSMFGKNILVTVYNIYYKRKWKQRRKL